MATRDCGQESAMSTPCIGEAGHTGDWRSMRPEFDPDKCLAVKAGRPACFQCWAYCPEGVIKKEIGTQVNLDYCKGCGICAEVCPAGAITMVPENVEDAE